MLARPAVTIRVHIADPPQADALARLRAQLDGDIDPKPGPELWQPTRYRVLMRCSVLTAPATTPRPKSSA